MTSSLKPTQRLVARAVLAAVILSLACAASALGLSTGLSAPNQYNVAPYCQPTSNQPYEGTYCGPWTVPVDSANPFADSYGECVYWAIEARPDIWNDRSASDPDPGDWDAWTWVAHAQAEGLSVTGAPRPGDVAVWSRAQANNPTGHVAYVGAVNADGSITITEMNHYFGTQGGDRETLTRVPAPQGWEGLQFIHLPGADPGAGGPDGAPRSSQGPPAGASSHPGSAVITRVHLSSRRRRGRRARIAFTVRISHGRGIPAAVAVDGRYRVRLHSRRRSSHVFVLWATLSAGRWTVTVTCLPARGYAAPGPVRMTVSVPLRGG